MEPFSGTSCLLLHKMAISESLTYKKIAILDGVGSPLIREFSRYEEFQSSSRQILFSIMIIL